MACAAPVYSCTGLGQGNFLSIELMKVDNAAWSAEIPDVEKHFEQFVDKLPSRLKDQLEKLKKYSAKKRLLI